MNANLHAWRSRRFSYGIEESRKNRARELDMYTVVPDIDHALIRVALSGFWDTAVAKRYVGELSTAVACVVDHHGSFNLRSEEHTSELQSLMRISYAALCLKKKKDTRLLFNICTVNRLIIRLTAHY